jgi:hypothetical protein
LVEKRERTNHLGSCCTTFLLCEARLFLIATTPTPKPKGKIKVEVLDVFGELLNWYVTSHLQREAMFLSGFPLCHQRRTQKWWPQL